MDQQKTQTGVVLGVDTHLDVHVAVVVDALGRVLATESIAPCEAGYQHLFEWASSFGSLAQAGVEGTGTYGAGLANYLAEAGVEVIEVNRPNRLRRRLRGKSDPTDAENAARAVLSGEANAQPKTQAGIVEAIRAVSVAPDRLRNDAALAALCGVSPLEASSGKVVRHRLNRGGDRRANNALWTITLVRMRSEPRTKAYVARRTQEGRSTKEIQRCLKRYLVRELYPLIVADLRSLAATA